MPGARIQQIHLENLENPSRRKDWKAFRLAKTDWENALAASESPNQSRPPGNWRLFAGVISIVAVTLGLGFYWPLQRGERILSREYSGLKQQTTDLQQKLDEASTNLAAVNTERSTLLAHKTESDAKLTEQKESLERLVAGISQRFQQALDRQKLRAAQLPDRVQVEMLDPSVFTSNGDALTGSGQLLVCALAAEAKRQGRFRIVVRAFASPSAPDGLRDSRWSSAARQAGALAEAMVSRCGIAADQLEVTTSIGRALAEAPRLELYPSEKR
jgi:hypothetical protein